MRYEDAVAQLASLPEVLPPWSAALRPIRLGADGRPRPDDTGGDRFGTGPRGRPASVLVLITPGENGEAEVILTERAAVMGDPHSGQISFPGGMAEPEDRDAVATALREAAEEVGLDPAAAGVRVVGLLDVFELAVSGFSVTPVLAIADHRPELFPAPQEVARILTAPIRQFLPGASIEVHERPDGEWTLRYGAYRVDEAIVWGATARILSQLGALLGE